MTEYTRLRLQHGINIVKVNMADGDKTESRWTESLDLDDPSIISIQTEGSRDVYINGELNHTRYPGHFLLKLDGIEEYTSNGAIQLSQAVGRSVHWCMSGGGIRKFRVSKVDAVQGEVVTFDPGDKIFVCKGSFDADGTALEEETQVTFSIPRTLTVKSDRALAFRLVPR